MKNPKVMVRGNGTMDHVYVVSDFKIGSSNVPVKKYDSLGGIYNVSSILMDIGNV
jgi:hypothetical protein